MERYSTFREGELMPLVRLITIMFLIGVVFLVFG